MLSHLTYTHQLGRHLGKAIFTNVHTSSSQPSDGCMLCSLSLPYESCVLRIFWKCCHGYSHSSANGDCLAPLHCMQITAVLTSSSLSSSLYHSDIQVSHKYQWICLHHGRRFLLHLFYRWRNRNTHVFLASHCGMNCTVRISAQDLQNVLPYVQGTGEETTEITSTEHFCFHSIWRTKARQTFMGPCCQPMAMERIWFASTAHIYSPALPSPALRTVHNPSWALRHSVSPADCLCARTALCPSGSGSQD